MIASQSTAKAQPKHSQSTAKDASQSKSVHSACASQSMKVLVGGMNPVVPSPACSCSSGGGGSSSSSRPRPSQVEFATLLPTEIDHVGNIFPQAGSGRGWEGWWFLGVANEYIQPSSA